MGIARVPGADLKSVVSDSAVDWTCGRRAGSHVMRARLAVLAVLALAGLIAVLGVTAISVSGAGHEAEVRITAQRLADGRTEFALQQREADGGWSERLLPRVRLFPATAAVGRWLSSTPLTVRGPGGGDDAAGTEVRITAQRLADGRTEFALQERDVDGGWGERLLPRGRFFPARATVGRWLSSTPLTVSVPGADDDAAGTEVRITAQRLADGRTEFALQERDVDGGWGERLLTQGNGSYPATATVGSVVVEHAVDGEPAGAAGIGGHERRRERGVGPGGAGRPLQTPPVARAGSPARTG